MQIHASCVARAGRGLLLLGPSGAGKSDLALRLLARGFVLVADDRVELAAGPDGRVTAAPPSPLAGLLEIRGVGLLRRPFEAPVAVALALDLAAPPARLPEPCPPGLLGVPVLAFAPWESAAPEKAAFALDGASGAASYAAGAFAAQRR